MKITLFQCVVSIVLLLIAFNNFLVLAEEPVQQKPDATIVAAQALLRGDAKRGALVFYKSAAACVKCHASGKNASPLGPDLTTIAKDATDQFIVESILEPSKSIRKGFETITIVTVDGKAISGMVAEDKKDRLVLRDAANLEQEIQIPKRNIDEIIVSKKSMMPENLASTLQSERDLFDLVRYVIEVARGGKQRAAELQPDPKDLIVKDDSINLDHAGILRSLGSKDFNAGKQIYLGHCKNCHGTDGNSPTLPTARAFGKQPFKYGADPYKMLLTLTKGAGLMTPMQHLSPKERYQVVHYIREALMKPSNRSYREVDEVYLSNLPKGTSQGEFVTTTNDRDFGPILGSQIASEVNSALTFRLPDDVTVSYDLHRMRLAGAWTGGFLDLSQTHHYRQRGERMPQIEGELIAGLSEWQWAFDGTFNIPADAKPARGPVRSDWLQYYGHYLHGDRALLSYGIHGRKILETIDKSNPNGHLTLHHTLRIEAGTKPLQLCIARMNRGDGPAGVIAAEELKNVGLSGPASNHFAVISGHVDSRPKRPKMANRPRHVVAGKKAVQLDLGTPDRTIMVRFRTKNAGTLVASAPSKGRWRPNGKTLFIRGKRLVYDIGWVGAMVGKSDVSDGNWHVAALVVTNNETKMFVDGQLESRRENFRRDPAKGHVLKVGATATDFGGDYAGDIDWVRIYDSKLSPDELAQKTETEQPPKRKTLFSWEPKKNDTETASRKPGSSDTIVAAAVTGSTEGTAWNIDKSGRVVLTIPPDDQPRVLRILRCSSSDSSIQKLTSSLRLAARDELVDPLKLTRGGPQRWPRAIEMRGVRGESINGYALDTIPVPFKNPWNAWLRTSALDFFDDGRAVVTTHGGDVYIVSGIDKGLERIVWKRFTAGLFEPFGVRVVDGTIYVTCRDGIKRLHDYNNDGEADFVEAFWIDDDVSSMFHAYNFDLQTDSKGNFYFAKAGQYTRHHRPGTIMRIPPQGGRADVVAWGLRTPNGMGKLKDDRFTVSDNQGPWMPAGKISLIKPGSFLGNMPINKEQTEWLQQKHDGELPDKFDEPIVWTPQELDNSCGGQIWVDDRRFGPLSGRLIHSSFGKGWLYYLSLQDINDQTQASIVALPHQWDAGVMRLRVNPADGQLYGTGLSGWQGPRGGKDGCLQRLRYTGEPVKMIDKLRVVSDGLEVRFNFEVDPKTACDPQSWRGEMWDYLWSKRYGSDQYSVLKKGEKGRDKLRISSARLMNSKQVHLTIPDLQVCDQVSLKMNFDNSQGERFIEHVYLTIHAMPSQ